MTTVAPGRALADYAKERERELNDQALSLAQARRLAQELNRFKRTMGAETMINRLSAPQVHAYLRGDNASVFPGRSIVAGREVGRVGVCSSVVGT